MKILHEAEYICECDFWNDEPKFCPTQELIRCKDCKYWDTDHEGTDLMFCHISDWNRLIRTAEDYCSKAERKEE